MDFSQQGNAGKRVFSRALRFSPRHDVRGAIVYFLIFLLFAFRRASNPRDYNDVVLQSLALDRRTIEREIRSCRVVFRFLLFNFFPATASRAPLPSLPSVKRRMAFFSAFCLPVQFSVLSLLLRANLFILDRIRSYIRHTVVQPFY